MASSIRLFAVGVIVLALCMLVADAVDKNNFKTCAQSGFCRRNRKLSDAESVQSAFRVAEKTVGFRKPGLLVADLENAITNKRFALEVHFFVDKQLRLKINEKEPLHPRYEVQDVIVDQPNLAAASLGGANGQSILKDDVSGLVIIIHHEPFSVQVLDGKTVVLTFNHRGLLNFEHLRTREETLAAAPPPPAAVVADDADTVEDVPAATVATPSDDLWEETFKGVSDKKPYGPESIGLDITLGGITHVYGLPEHSSPLNLPDTKGPGSKYTDPYRLYNLDVFEYELDNPMALYGSIPFLLGHRAGLSVGLFWHNAAETWIDVTRTTPDTTPVNTGTHWFSESGIIDVFAFIGTTPSEVLRKYTAITGTTAMPRLFALAYHQCRWNYNDEQDVAGVDQGFETYDIPYDVLWLDIEHTDAKKYFTWDAVKFPNPIAMQANLQKKSRKMVTIVDPHIKRVSGYPVHEQALSQDLYVKDDNNAPFEGWCWPGSSSWVDFTNPAAREWWIQKFALNQYVGSTSDLFTWNDMNEPSVFNGPEITMHKYNRHFGGWEHRDVHNVYGFYQLWSTSEALKRRDNKRSFVLSRAFFAGSQRHGAIWTGDNTANYEHMRASIPMLLSINIAGLPFAGADVGGFFGNPSEELLTRWYEVGSFQPFFRGHAHLDSRRREPWVFGEPYTSLIRASIRRRYTLLPLWYTLFREASLTGSAVMRPLFYEFPNDPSTFAIEDAFMVGSALLVHPVVTMGQTTQTVFLPGAQQVWYNYDTFAPTVGPAQITLDAPLGRTPVFYRGGSIIPRKDRVRRSSSLMANDPYTIVIALDSKGEATGRLYFDDGESFLYQTGAYADKNISYKANVISSKDFDAVPAAHKAQHDAFEKASIPVIERIIIIGLPRLPKTITSKDQTKLEFFAEPSVKSVVIKRPNFKAASDWSIDLSF